MSNNGIEIHLQQDKIIPLDVEFNCHSGEILVIVGPSGSGKSTTLRAISGLYTPQHGQISSNGACWLDTNKNINLSVQQRKTGMVFQHYALFPHMNALENIQIALNDDNTSRRQNRAKTLLKLINMEGLEKRLPAQLSGGQQQRIALARALARDPDVLLLDEPFSAVDQQTRRKLVRELLQLRKQIDIPIIHVTHNLNEARRIADRLCILHHGKTLQIDSPDKVMNKPVNSNVANLIGHYNIYQATVLNHDADKQITWLDWHGHKLEAAYQPEMTMGNPCKWLIPTQNVLLHRQDKPSRGERENPLHGEISEYIKLGETVSIKMRLPVAESIYLNIPTHVANRNKLAEGEKISVSLLADAIHLMPASL